MKRTSRTAAAPAARPTISMSQLNAAGPVDHPESGDATNRTNASPGSTTASTRHVGTVDRAASMPGAGFADLVGSGR